MRIKLDENLPARLAEALFRLGHDTDTVQAEGLKGRTDPEIWASAREARRFFVTQDLDFSDRRRYSPGTRHAVLLVRLREPGRQALFDRVLDVFRGEDVEVLSTCFVVATDRKTRILRP